VKEGLLVVIGGGLAGCEAAWQAAKRGISVLLYEMKPGRFSPAHRSDKLAELVCSNSLRSDSIENAVGLLKEEMRRLDSLILEAAQETRVPAGGALAVDREQFSAFITERIENLPHVEVRREEIKKIPESELTIVATGPLTSEDLAHELVRLAGAEDLYFYDAIAPIVEAESIDMTTAFKASRYNKGEGDYINCPMTKEQYETFVDEILRAEKVPLRTFEKEVYFEGCMPIEIMAERGRQSLAFGPMKPVGLVDSKTGKQPYAVVQLRQDDACGSLYNMVGFQTKMTWKEQPGIFRKIPGLENAQFHRLGSVHRNTYLNAPSILEKTLQIKGLPHIFLAGQLCGVEGYVESSAMGLLAGINGARKVLGEHQMTPPPTTVLGALVLYITEANPVGFQPMNANFGLFPPPSKRLKKGIRRKALAKRALTDLTQWIDQNQIMDDRIYGCLEKGGSDG
jgi:methylenetetrahydrofolate--tRNA-(uracil-5-)-methyltransferase